MSKNKWGFTTAFINEAVKKQENNGMQINKQKIAYDMIEHFKLRITPEAGRKIVSRILNKKKRPVLDFNNITETVEVKKDFKKVLCESSKPIPQIKLTKFRKEGLHIVTGCWHVPFQNQAITEGIYELLHDLEDQIVGFHIIGDFLDLNTLSSHDRGRFTAIPGLSLPQEYKEGNKVLDVIDKVLPSEIDKTYIYGNHEDRYLRYIRDMENSKVPPQSPEEALYLEERGYYVYNNWSDDYITLGQHLDLVHGTYYNVHCAKKHMDVFRGSVMFAHTHRVQTYIEGNTGAFNIGFLGDKKSRAFGYAARATKSSWQNGFAVVYIDKNGDYYVNNIICNNNKFYYNGKEYGNV